MPIRYDRAILQTHVDALYDRADDIAWNTAVGSAMSLAAAGGIAGFAAAYGFGLDVMLWIVGGVMIGGIIGFASGWQAGEQQAFKLRLQAQELLCQMMIEKNTANLLRLAIRQADSPAGQLDDATLEALRPGRSMRSRMGRLGQ